jgi:integrase
VHQGAARDALVAACKTRKPRSVRRTYSALAAAFNAAVAADMVARSPCVGVKLPAVEPATARVPSAHDLRRLKDELPIQYRAMVTLGANLGLRFGETAGLRVGRLDLEAGILHVEEAVGEANGVLFTKPPVGRIAEHLAGTVFAGEEHGGGSAVRT